MSGLACHQPGEPAVSGGLIRALTDILPIYATRDVGPLHVDVDLDWRSPTRQMSVRVRIAREGRRGIAAAPPRAAITRVIDARRDNLAKSQRPRRSVRGK